MGRASEWMGLKRLLRDERMQTMGFDVGRCAGTWSSFAIRPRVDPGGEWGGVGPDSRQAIRQVI